MWTSLLIAAPTSFALQPRAQHPPPSLGPSLLVSSSASSSLPATTSDLSTSSGVNPSSSSVQKLPQRGKRNLRGTGTSQECELALSFLQPFSSLRLTPTVPPRCQHLPTVVSTDCHFSFWRPRTFDLLKRSSSSILVWSTFHPLDPSSWSVHDHSRPTTKPNSAVLGFD